MSSQTSLNKTPSSGSSRLTPAQSSRPTSRSNFNADAWQNHKQRNYGFPNRSLSYARAANTQPGVAGVRQSPKRSPIEESVAASSDSGDGTEASDKDKATMRKMFEEMFRGRVEANVIEMVLQEAEWNGKNTI